MKEKTKTLLICLSIPLITGGLSAYLSRSGMSQFSQMAQPPLSPPAWLFPVVWTMLYLLMGYASYLIITSHCPAVLSIKRALISYGIQLFFNFFWSIIFFGFGAYLFAFIWLIALWVMVLLTLIMFYSIEKKAGYLLIPYILWVSFAGYLNFGVWLLNRC